MSQIDARLDEQRQANRIEEQPRRRINWWALLALIILVAGYIYYGVTIWGGPK